MSLVRFKARNHRQQRINPDVDDRSSDDGLSRSWEGERVWCNPPYSNIGPWVLKAWLSRADIVVMILPANRCEQSFWQVLVEPFRDRGLGLRTRFLAGRTRFIRANSDRIGPNERPPFGCVLLIFDAPRPEQIFQPGPLFLEASA